MTESVEEVIADRAQRYGPFHETAGVCADLKAAMRAGRSWGSMTMVEREALDMIAMKIARICTGRESRDSFTDMAGYATLAARHVVR